MKLAIQLFCNMGVRYVFFRTLYELRRRSGLLKKKYPVFIPSKNYISLDCWRKTSKPFFFKDRSDVNIQNNSNLGMSKELERLLNGECLYFSSTWMHVGKEYDWLTNPDTKYKYDISQHWTDINDFSKEAGDIKFVWEKSRFSYLYTIIRHDQGTKESHAEYVFSQILDWIEKNPLNCGPNYKCSQEISLRVLNWVFALYFYKSDKSLTEEVFRKILDSIYGQICHVYANINFSRIAVRNNHAITETLALYIVGLLFPWFPKASKWKRDGKKWFEKEVTYQIAEDGTYLQFSMNYHRVVVQLLTWGIGLAEKNGERFTNEVYQRAYKSVDFLLQCQNTETGMLPNYGANDGALFFNLNDKEYRDFRPQLDALHYLLTGKNLYQTFFEDRLWYNGVIESPFTPLKQTDGLISFDIGGYYLVRERDVLTFIRCGRYKDRPSHADNLHLDIWYKGENMLLDGGSYKYNTTDVNTKYFVGTESHNTVMLDDYDQMLKGARFIWFYWTQAEKWSFFETNEAYVFEGTVNCFSYLKSNIKHVRRIVKSKRGLSWDVEDMIKNKPYNAVMRQLWHTQSQHLNFISDGTDCLENEKWFSSYYGQKETCKQIVFKTQGNIIKTSIQII